MREMKDSGLVWLGKIPAGWSLTKIGGLYSIRNEKVSDKDYPPLSVTNKGILPQLETAAKTNDGENRKLVRIGDFAINSRSDRRGSCGISPYNGSVSLINIVMMPREKMVPTYYEWLFHTTQFGDENYRWGHGIVDDLWTTGWQEMKKITIPMPPLDEQKRIADYLNAKCAEIDALAADIQTQINTLEQYKSSVITEAVTKGLNPDAEMKDSGIEWVGMIPSTWIMRKGKYMFVQRSMRGNSIELQLLSPTQKFGVIPQSLYEELTGMSAVKLNEKADLSLLKTIHRGDFCISLRSFQGGFEYSEYEGVVSPAYQVFYPTVEIADGYYHYLFKEAGFIDKMNSYTMTLRDGKNIAFADFGNTYIPYPPVEEQTAIAIYLDGRCAQINALIDQKNEQLSTLDAYKKSLIYEYVTGKKIVTEGVASVGTVMIDPHVIMAGIIIDQLGQEQKGKIQIQKLLYLYDFYLGMNLNTQYYRYNHGPYDQNLDRYLNILVANGWFREVSEGAIKYEKGRNHADFCAKYKDTFAEYRSRMSRLISFVKGLRRTSQIERIATAFAVWNDLILDGVSKPTDSQIIDEIQTTWTPNKANSSTDTWEDTLQKMKKQGIIPRGRGRHTLPRPQRGG